MVVETPITLPTTVEEFDQWVILPENVGRDFEFINARVKAVVSSNRSSVITMRIGARITLFVEEHDLGHITSSDGGYRVAGQRYIPDVAFISKAKLPTPTDDAYLPIAPDLVVEVLSPANSDEEIRTKIVNYLSENVTVWVVNPAVKHVEVYVPGQKAVVLTVDDVLDGAPVLTGFSLPLKLIFKD